MIAWLNPAAFAALALAALPVLIHLLLRRRAPRLVVPSLRFLAPTAESAVRVRVPSDLLLLLVRAAIVVCAALAVARPLLVTDARREAWAQNTVRAIVVDTSRSVDGTVAAEAATAASRGAASFRRFEAAALRDGIHRAAAWLATSPPARREIVVVSDFQRGVLTPDDLLSVPESIGLRHVRVAGVEMPRTFDGEAILRGPGAAVPMVDAGPEGTTVAFRQGSAPAVRIEAPPDIAARVVRAVAEAGALAPVEGQAAIRLPAGVRTDSLEAAAFVQASLNARRDSDAWAEREPERLPAPEVESANRAPSAPPLDGWTRSDESDGRWLWAAAIILMLVEAVLRRGRGGAQAAAEVRRAA